MVRSDEELEKMEKNRDIGQEVLDGVREILSGKGRKASVSLPASARVRKASGLSRRELAERRGSCSGLSGNGSRVAENLRKLRRSFSKKQRRIPTL